MSGIKITDLPLSTTPLSGTEVVPLVQDGVTKQVSVSNLTDGRSINASSVTTSSGVTVGAGTASAPSLIPSGDTNTGMWFPAADTIAWSTGGSERMRIGSDGKVGIGTSAPNSALEVVTGGTADFFARSTSSTGLSEIGAIRNDYVSLPSFAGVLLRQYGANRTGTTYGISNASQGLLAFQNVNNAVIGTNNATPLIFATLATERLRIDPNGNVGFNTTSFGASSNGVVAIGNAAAVPTGNPTGGGVLYVEAGALKYRGSSGTVTTIANA